MHTYANVQKSLGLMEIFGINFPFPRYAWTMLRAADILVASQFSNSVHFFQTPQNTRGWLLCAYLTQPFTLLFTFRFSFSLPLVVAFVSCWHAFFIFFRSLFLLPSYWKKGILDTRRTICAICDYNIDFFTLLPPEKKFCEIKKKKN